MRVELYKQGKKDKILYWKIEVAGNKYRCVHGEVDGAKVTTEWTTCFGKNLGRANETSPEEQSLAEAKSKARDKKDKGYCEDIDEIQVKFVPTLAHKYKDFKKDIIWPVLVSGKYDGVRCVIDKYGMWSRKGKEFLSCPHIKEELAEFFSLFPDAVLDGELYNHDFKDDFNKIISLVRKTKPTPENLEESRELIQFHIFDYISTEGYKERMEWLKSNLPETKNIVFIDQIEAKDETEMLEKFAGYIEQGYEGAMIRWGDKPYIYDRTKHLLKYKTFQSEEFPVLDVLEGEGNRSGMMGKFLLKIGDDTFEASARGNWEQYREWLENKEKYIGKMATIRYQNLTPAGIPRFGVLVAIRDYE